MGDSPDGTFRPQPWGQAVKVLRDMGHEEDARELAVKREILRSQSAATRWHLKAWLRLLHITIGFGYKPHYALYWSAGFLLIGWIIFGAAADLGFMAPRDGSVQAYLASAARDGRGSARLPEHYTRFNAPVFALDNYLPIIELGQDLSWEPSDVQTGHRRDTSACYSTHGSKGGSWYCDAVEAVRMALGHDWTITGVPTRSEKVKPFYEPDLATAVAMWAFRLGLHRFVYWSLELLGWLFVSLYIAGMSGLMKKE
ncbi:MAG: hypothetical protein JOY77_07965 [Alphaproteobacteria bacterium]|nr:hypothetical protein [Alphaproteobacteria bacterium]